METNERGSVLPLVALIVVAAGAATILAGRLGEAAVARARAQTAADAAALAGAASDEGTADGVAEANGARLMRYEELPDGARVEVSLGHAEARARARRVGGDPGAGSGTGGPPGTAGAHGLAPAMRAALARAAQLLGRPVPVVSGWRSTRAQAALWARRATNPYPVAPPGRSMHERGLAVDVPHDVAPVLAAIAARAGLCRPYPQSDPVHFELCVGG